MFSLCSHLLTAAALCCGDRADQPVSVVMKDRLDLRRLTLLVEIEIMIRAIDIRPVLHLPNIVRMRKAIRLGHVQRQPDALRPGSLESD